MRVIGDGGHAAVVRGLPSRFDDPGYVVAVGDNADRRKESLRQTGSACEALVHGKAFVDPSATLGEGTVVLAMAVVAARARIGKHVIINHGATCDHDVIIGDFAHIAPGVHLCGGVVVGEGALVGVGSCAVPGAQINSWTVVRAGSVVTLDKP